jgi:hypothetical protein
MGKQTGCYEDLITANPNRPTVSNPAHVTQFGVMELEYGPDRTWPQEGISQTSGNGLLKFGLLCDIELRWNTTSFLSQTDATGTHSTFGDNWLGTEIRFHRQSTWLPTMAFSYSFKIPSASPENGLGTGRVDHSFTFGASETIAHFTFDFNFTRFLIGQPSAGFDQNQQMALAFSYAICVKHKERAGGIRGFPRKPCIRSLAWFALQRGPPVFRGRRRESFLRELEVIRET